MLLRSKASLPLDQRYQTTAIEEPHAAPSDEAFDAVFAANHSIQARRDAHARCP
jgi:hypothetical protein